MKTEYPRYDPTDDTVNIRRSWNLWQAATAAERERCIDLVAMFGGSVEIEAAIRKG